MVMEQAHLIVRISPERNDVGDTTNVHPHFIFPDVLIPKSQFCKNAISDFLMNSNAWFAPEQEYYFSSLDREELVLPTGFEPVLKPREGFMIGRYTTGATFHSIVR